MRRHGRGFVVAGLLILAGLGSAFAEAPKNEQPDRLKTILAEYEKASNAIREIHYEFKRTDTDPIFKQKTTGTGQVTYRKPDLVRIDEKMEKEETSHFLFMDRKIHLFNHLRKTEMIFGPLPKEFGYPEHPEVYPKSDGFWGNLLNPGVWLVGPASLYLPLPIRHLEQTCQLRVTSEDEHWICLVVKPTERGMKGSFEQMEVVLNAKTYHIRRVCLYEPTGRMVCVDVEKAVINPKEGVTPETIRKGLPQGWKQEESKAVLPEIKWEGQKK